MKSSSIIRIAALLLLAGIPAVYAADPSAGTVSKGKRTATWSGGPYTVGVPNQLGCLTPSNPTCDAFALTADIKPGASFAVAITSAILDDDYDLYVYYPDGTEAGRSANAGSNESVVITHTTLHGSGPYAVRVLPFAVASGSTYQGVARSTKEVGIDPEDLNTCLEAVPAAVGVGGVTDDGRTVAIDVAVLLDGVSLGLGNQIMAKAAEAYAPLGLDLRAVSYRSVAFTGTEGADIIQQAKNYYGGVRPAGSDLVYVLTSKDITDAGDTGLAGLADCIGGVRFPYHAFAVGEAVGIDPINIGPFVLEVNAHPEIAAHEMGHLMGAHHHYANCVEGILEGEATDLSPCTLMFNFVDFQSLNFSQVNRAVVRGHAVQYATP
jgi:Metallo-peptidase family M12B Reprolysin-like